ncbi:MAG: recombination protein O N-terminal domain-containing protein, partial [Muribaculaceae bacterium]|nr:recombination protein O N-terminal domain-containing protein [Muribaculaceae bacterium]
MYTHLDCIALRTTKVSDSKNLLSAWTRTHGRLTFSLPAGAGREARRRRALT